MKTVNKTAAKKLNQAFSLMDVVIGVTLFSIFFTSIVFGYSSLFKLTIKIKQKIYNNLDKVNEITQKYYQDQEEE